MFEDVIPTYKLTSKFANLFLHLDGWTICFFEYLISKLFTFPPIFLFLLINDLFFSGIGENFAWFSNLLLSNEWIIVLFSTIFSYRIGG